jgi:uncharacterized repeat protein (TIGR03806 family)
MSHRVAAQLCAAIFAFTLSACGNSTAPQGGGLNAGDAGTVVTGKTTTICSGPDAEKQAIVAFFDAHEGDTIEFCEGKFDFAHGLVMTGKRGVTIKGQGKDKTYLRFASSNDQDGFNLQKMTGITVQGLTIYDAPGNGLRIFRSDYVTVRDVKVGWSQSDPASPYGNYAAPDSITGKPPSGWATNGAYAFYPVICHHVLIEDSISVGSSDAGVYVGQSSDILVRRTEAYHNVAGFEFENTYRAEFVDNYAHDNVGGFLIFDLPGRVQFGEKNSVHHNKSYHNNLPQFAPRGAIVAAVPSGTGALVLASDQLEFYGNDVQDNNTYGIVIANYGLIDSNYPQTRYDFFPEGMHIYNNIFKDNGGSPQIPDLNRNPCKGPSGLPDPSQGDSIDCPTGNPGLLVTIVTAKNGGHSSQVAWDGGVDTLNSECTSIPTDRAGIPLTQPNANETRTERYEARSDERGRPNLYQYDPEPKCKYNAWKFDNAGKLKSPTMGMCVENNTFIKSTPQMQLVSDYVNAHFGTADPTNPVNLQPADNTMPDGAANCPIVAAPLLPQFVPNLGSFTANPANDPRPSQAQLAAVCSGGPPGTPNYDALARFNCPKLSDYGLFVDATDPTKNPTGNGLPYELNTPLFTDYASKHRFIYLPPGSKATYQDHTQCDTLNVYDCYTATLGFPVGTVIAKTFSYQDGATENVIETRLLIKRTAHDGTPVWVGFSYEWTTENGQKVANLRLEGATKSVSWNYDDPNPAVKDGSGKVQHYQGSTARYAIPSAGACLLCHGGDDREAGTAPIGPKVRNLNRDNTYGGETVNQLTYMQAHGLLDLPAGKTPSQLEVLPKWNVPGSGGDTAGSHDDEHHRVMAFLETNCYHCHNPAGGAQNSGLRLDSFTNPLPTNHGICKPPIAAGKGADSGTYDIQPGSAGVSILINRVASTTAGIQMPPTARSVTQTEAVNLLTDWVTNVVADYAAQSANTCSKSTPGIGFALPAGILPAYLLAPERIVPPTHAQTAPFG